jgi:hypothetical protein
MRQAIIISSTSQHDILQVIDKGYWEHSSTPQAVNKGDLIYIMPNQQQRDLYGLNAFVIEGTVNDIDDDHMCDTDWVSNKVEGSTQQCVCRVSINNPKIVMLDNIKSFLMSSRMGPKGIKYITL